VPGPKRPVLLMRLALRYWPVPKMLVLQMKLVPLMRVSLRKLVRPMIWVPLMMLVHYCLLVLKRLVLLKIPDLMTKPVLLRRMVERCLTVPRRLVQQKNLV
jgi:hypothetical protein